VKSVQTCLTALLATGTLACLTLGPVYLLSAIAP
jgi:hypothetical protein